MGWLGGWSRRQALAVSNFSAECQVLLDLSTINWDSVASDGADIRVTDSDGTTLLSIYLEEFDYGAQTGKLWIKLPATYSGDLYLYTGNPSATSASDADAVFEFFDDFEGTAVDSDKWNIYYSGKVSVSESVLCITNDLASTVIVGIVAKIGFDTTNKIVEAYSRASTDSTYPFLVGATDVVTGDPTSATGNSYSLYEYTTYGAFAAVSRYNGNRTYVSLRVPSTQYHIWSIIQSNDTNLIFQQDGAQIASINNSTCIPRGYLYAQHCTKKYKTDNPNYTLYCAVSYTHLTLPTN